MVISKTTVSIELSKWSGRTAFLSCSLGRMCAKCSSCWFWCQRNLLLALRMLARALRSQNMASENLCNPLSDDHSRQEGGNPDGASPPDEVKVCVARVLRKKIYQTCSDRKPGVFPLFPTDNETATTSPESKLISMSKAFWSLMEEV